MFSGLGTKAGKCLLGCALTAFGRLPPSSGLRSTVVTLGLKEFGGRHSSECFLHTSACRLDLMEFFDNKKNWGAEEVKCGRPWRKEELRIKSNEDLHKLWYVLLKERNMLLTMEHEYKRSAELFPNPERTFKVEESMENLLVVVAERNKAYHLLEEGTTKEPKVRVARNFMGLKYRRVEREYAIPKYMNRSYLMWHAPYPKSVLKYLNLYFEKKRLERNRARRIELKHRKKLRELFPNAEIDDE